MTDRQVTDTIVLENIPFQRQLVVSDQELEPYAYSDRHRAFLHMK